jgi:hypothetical protein
MSEFPHLEGFKFEDYAKKEQEKQEGSLEGEIEQAAENQDERQTSTPDTDWEQRYKELEKLNSRQAQELGHLRQETAQYRTAFDEYLLNDDPTPSESSDAPVSITTDDLLEHPDEAINRMIENHPAIRQAKDAVETQRRNAVLAAKGEFERKHPNYQETMSDPAFANWVQDNPTRLQLAQAADKWDFGAADALFSLYESEQALNGMTEKQRQSDALAQAELESAGVGEPPPEAKFSRHDMRELMIKAKQGHPESERLLNKLLPAYRAALASGEVTD